MDRWDWMAVRAYLPTAYALLVALALRWIFSSWQDSTHLAGLYEVVQWLPRAAFVFAVGHGLCMTYRLWRAEQGEGLLCDCGGLLGRERQGRASRGGPYRRCLACSRNINHQHYE